MDPAEPPELLHRRDLDKLNAGVAALLDERLAEDGVGCLSTVPASRHLHGKYAQADPRKYGL